MQKTGLIVYKSQKRAPLGSPFNLLAASEAVTDTNSEFVADTIGVR